MGGLINMYIRTPDEEFLKMIRSTNTLPWFVQFSMFEDNPDAVLEDYLRNWKEMKEDYEENKKTKNFRNPMTSSLFPAPKSIKYDGYGAVFVDFKTKTIITRQDYCSFDSIILGKYIIDLTPNYDGKYSDEELLNLVFKKGTRVFITDFLKEEQIHRTQEMFSTDEIIHYVMIKEYTIHIKFETNGWKIIDLDDGTSQRKFKSMVDNLLAQ